MAIIMVTTIIEVIALISMLLGACAAAQKMRKPLRTRLRMYMKKTTATIFGMWLYLRTLFITFRR